MALIGGGQEIPFFAGGAFGRRNTGGAVFRANLTDSCQVVVVSFEGDAPHLRAFDLSEIFGSGAGDAHSSGDAGEAIIGARNASPGLIVGKGPEGAGQEAAAAVEVEVGLALKTSSK